MNELEMTTQGRKIPSIKNQNDTLEETCQVPI